MNDFEKKGFKNADGDHCAARGENGVNPSLVKTPQEKLAFKCRGPEECVIED